MEVVDVVVRDCCSLPASMIRNIRSQGLYPLQNQSFWSVDSSLKRSIDFSLEGNLNWELIKRREE